MISVEEIERTFLLIEQAALNGERCPQNEPFGPIRTAALAQLYKTERVRCEIYQKNFRRITILTGPNRGRSTAGPPIAAQPWKVIPQRFPILRRQV